MGIIFCKYSERGKEKQMRNIVMNQINVITRPATGRFDFLCFQAPTFDQIAVVRKEGNDKDWDKNRFRYRRY
jgi:hypothetical protein